MRDSSIIFILHHHKTDFNQSDTSHSEMRRDETRMKREGIQWQKLRISQLSTELTSRNLTQRDIFPFYTLRTFRKLYFWTFTWVNKLNQYFLFPHTSICTSTWVCVALFLLAEKAWTFLRRLLNAQCRVQVTSVRGAEWTVLRHHF